MLRRGRDQHLLLLQPGGEAAITHFPPVLQPTHEAPNGTVTGDQGGLCCPHTCSDAPRHPARPTCPTAQSPTQCILAASFTAVLKDRQDLQRTDDLTELPRYRKKHRKGSDQTPIYHRLHVSCCTEHLSTPNHTQQKS